MAKLMGANIFSVLRIADNIVDTIPPTSILQLHSFLEVKLSIHTPLIPLQNIAYYNAIDLVDIIFFHTFVLANREMLQFVGLGNY